MKYIHAFRGAIALWRTLRGKNIKKFTAMEAFNAASDASNPLLKRYPIYDETMWLYWLGTGNVPMPTFMPSSSGTAWLDGVGCCDVTWIKPRLFCRASAW